MIRKNSSSGLDVGDNDYRCEARGETMRKRWNNEPEAWECADCGEIFNTAEEADACWNATNWPEDAQWKMRYGLVEIPAQIFA